MRKISIIFAIIFITLFSIIFIIDKSKTNNSVLSETNISCNTNLNPSDPTDKFISALNCLNNQVAELKKTVELASSAAQDSESRAAAAEAAANRAARAAEEVNSKLDRLFAKTMMQQ